MNCGGVNFPDGTIHPPARSSDADQTGICQLPPPREGKDDTKSGGTTAPQVNAEPSRQNEVWRRSAAADGPNTVDPSPASNTATNTSGTRPEFAFVRKMKMVPTPPNRKPSIAMSRNIEMDLNAFVTKTALATALRQWARGMPVRLRPLTAAASTFLGKSREE
ncbi:hypothetical protein TcCL_Unassigned05410 [Trypanosoma cruzi]|nr:hypothetical protein TcCL_Unassigned05410 [Trypanosoma cruzi]